MANDKRGKARKALRAANRDRITQVALASNVLSTRQREKALFHIFWAQLPRV